MKYVQPYGITDPDAPYINGNPQTGIQGSIPPAAAFEHPMREIMGVIENSNLLPLDTDLLQLTQGVRSQYLNFVDDTGAVNALVVACIPALTQYNVGLPLRVRVLHTNTTTSVTLNAGLGAASIKKMDGADPSIGDLPAGGVIEVVYDGTNWQLVNFGGAGGGAGSVFAVNIPYIADTGTVNNIIANFSPALTTVIAGSVILVKLANTVTGGPLTITINALAVKNVKVTDGSNPLPADVIAGDILFLKYDGTNWIVDPGVAILVNCTFPVPSTQFPTVASVFEALKRKTISPSALVTIQLASGVYPPINIYHQNSDRIVIKGTMLAAAPTLASFARTGFSAGARAADFATNIVMLRSRYGTEIRFTAASHMSAVHYGYAVGVTNSGPGMPLLEDMLITGDNIPTANWASHCILLKGTKMQCKNIATWGSGGSGFAAQFGFLEGLSMLFACGHAYAGFIGNAMKFWFPVIGIGNGVCGAQAATGSIQCIPLNGGSHFECNGSFGGASTDTGFGMFWNCTMLNNGSADAWAYDGAQTYINGAAYGTTSPAPNVMGNMFAFIDTTHAAGSGPF